MEKRNLILFVIGIALVIGFVLSIVLPDSIWERVRSFYSDIFVPLAAIIEILVAGNVAYDKYQRRKTR